MPVYSVENLLAEWGSFVQAQSYMKPDWVESVKAELPWLKLREFPRITNGSGTTFSLETRKNISHTACLFPDGSP